MHVLHYFGWIIAHVCLGDIENQKPVNTWKLGTGVDHQQVGNTWSGDKDIVSLSLSGDMNIFDQRVGDKPARVLSVSSVSTKGANCVSDVQPLPTGYSEVYHELGLVRHRYFPCRQRRWTGPMVLTILE